MIGIVDYGAGNLRSLSNALVNLGFDYRTVRHPGHMDDLQSLLIPGVGSFRSAVLRLKQAELFEEIVTFAKSGRKITGICLGMQLLFEQGEEMGVTNGLALIPGRVVASRKISATQTIRIGWDHVVADSDMDLSGDYFFAHSFEAIDVPPEFQKGITNRGGRSVVAIVQKGNIIGIQFHPEKSGTRGLQVLNWALT